MFSTMIFSEKCACPLYSYGCHILRMRVVETTVHDLDTARDTKLADVSGLDIIRHDHPYEDRLRNKVCSQVKNTLDFIVD